MSPRAHVRLDPGLYTLPERRIPKAEVSPCLTRARAAFSALDGNGSLTDEWRMKQILNPCRRTGRRVWETGVLTSIRGGNLIFPVPERPVYGAIRLKFSQALALPPSQACL